MRLRGRERKGCNYISRGRNRTGLNGVGLTTIWTTRTEWGLHEPAADTQALCPAGLPQVGHEQAGALAVIHPQAASQSYLRRSFTMITSPRRTLRRYP